MVVPLSTMIRRTSFIVEVWISKLVGDPFSWYCFMSAARKFAEAGQSNEIPKLRQPDYSIFSALYHLALISSCPVFQGSHPEPPQRQTQPANLQAGDNDISLILLAESQLAKKTRSRTDY
jgi:hypothetical protein